MISKVNLLMPKTKTRDEDGDADKGEVAQEEGKEEAQTSEG